MVRILVSETYAIEDCYLYDGNTYQSSGTTTKTFNAQLPTNYTLSFDSYVPTSTGCNSYLAVGTDTNHRVGIGVVNGGAKYRLFIQDNASSGTSVDTTTSNTPASWVTQTAIIQGSTISYYDLTQTVSSTNTSKLWNANVYNGKIKNIKVKPL